MSTAAPSDQSTIPAWLTGLVDDAAIFPPGNSPMPEAVAAHGAYRTAPYSALVGPFVVSDARPPPWTTLHRGRLRQALPVVCVLALSLACSSQLKCA